MKPQDLVFIVILVFLLYKRRHELLVIAGIVCLLLSIPLFSFWIFFTAQRLVVYAFVFFLIAVIMLILKLRKLPK